MTLTLAFDRKHRGTPTVGYLSSTARRSDADCLNRSHLDAVLQARRDRENYAYRPGEPVQGRDTRVAGDATPGLPVVSIIERESAHPWRWVASFAACFVLACAAMFAPFAWQIAIGAVLCLAAGVAIVAAVRK